MYFYIIKRVIPEAQGNNGNCLPSDKASQTDLNLQQHHYENLVSHTDLFLFHNKHQPLLTAKSMTEDDKKMNKGTISTRHFIFIL
jgi:hypothetical protein